MTGIEYTKPPLTLTEQVARLRSRGMVINDQNAAEVFLLRTNYYRLAGYALPYEEFDIHGTRQDRFIAGTSFTDIVALHHFDEQLRILLLEYLSCIEISFRTVLCYEVAMTSSNAFWYTDQSLFYDHAEHIDCLNDIERDFARSKEVFIKAYKSKYSNQYPPSWMMIELASFGLCSRIYSNFRRHNSLQQRIADNYELHKAIFEQWIRSLVVLRNACAHQQRVWNRQFTYSPRITDDIRSRVAHPGRIAGHVAVMWHLLTKLDKADEFEARFYQLLSAFPVASLAEMGLPQ